MFAQDFVDRIEKYQTPEKRRFSKHDNVLLFTLRLSRQVPYHLLLTPSHSRETRLLQILIVTANKYEERYQSKNFYARHQDSEANRDTQQKALKVDSRISRNRALTSRRSIKLPDIYNSRLSTCWKIHRGARCKISTKFKELFSQYLSKVSVIVAFLYYRAVKRLL